MGLTSTDRTQRLKQLELQLAEEKKSKEAELAQVQQEHETHPSSVSSDGLSLRLRTTTRIILLCVINKYFSAFAVLVVLGCALYTSLQAVDASVHGAVK